MGNEKALSKTGNKLPQIAELYNDTAIALQKNELNILLNQPPASAWILKHPIAKNDYIPIARIEWLLTTIFQTWNVEIKSTMLIANSVVVQIRLHYVNPVTFEREFQDGIGAVALQTDKDASATDFSKVKSNAVQLAAPAAKTYAIKDAADHLGKLFGKDLNRKHQDNYINLQGRSEDIRKVELRNEFASILALVEDPDLKESIITEINEAEVNGVDSPSFYERLIENHG